VRACVRERERVRVWACVCARARCVRVRVCARVRVRVRACANGQDCQLDICDVVLLKMPEGRNTNTSARWPSDHVFIFAIVAKMFVCSF
jgi:hypothetical protein